MRCTWLERYHYSYVSYLMRDARPLHWDSDRSHRSLSSVSQHSSPLVPRTAAGACNNEVVSTWNRKKCTTSKFLWILSKLHSCKFNFVSNTMMQWYTGHLSLQIDIVYNIMYSFSDKMQPYIWKAKKCFYYYEISLSWYLVYGIVSLLRHHKRILTSLTHKP